MGYRNTGQLGENCDWQCLPISTLPDILSLTSSVVPCIIGIQSTGIGI